MTSRWLREIGRAFRNPPFSLGEFEIAEQLVREDEPPTY